MLLNKKQIFKPTVDHIKATVPIIIFPLNPIKFPDIKLATPAIKIGNMQYPKIHILDRIVLYIINI
jgi:hypothetical protein